MKNPKITNRKIVVSSEKKPFLDKIGDNKFVTCENISREIKMKYGAKI